MIKIWGMEGIRKQDFCMHLIKRYDIVVVLHGDSQYPSDRLDLTKPIEIYLSIIQDTLD